MVGHSSKGLPRNRAKLGGRMPRLAYGPVRARLLAANGCTASSSARPKAPAILSAPYGAPAPYGSYGQPPPPYGQGPPAGYGKHRPATGNQLTANRRTALLPGQHRHRQRTRHRPEQRRPRYRFPRWLAPKIRFRIRTSAGCGAARRTSCKSSSSHCPMWRGRACRISRWQPTTLRAR